MNDNVSSLVGVGAAGKVYVAPKGTALPTSASADLTGFENFGYISADGVTISGSDSSSSIYAWGGDSVRVISTEHTETVAFTPIEINETVLKQTYGDDNVTVTSSQDTTVIAARHTGVMLPEVVIVVDAIPATGMKSRYVLPLAQLTERGDAALTGTDIQGRQLTYTGNADGNGVTCYEYVEIASSVTAG